MNAAAILVMRCSQRHRNLALQEAGEVSATSPAFHSCQIPDMTSVADHPGALANERFGTVGGDDGGFAFLAG